VNALAVGDALDRRDGILLGDVDHMIGAQPLAHCEPALARAGEDHRRSAQRLGNADAHQADRPGTDHHHRLAGDDAAHDVEAIHGGAGRHDQRRLLVRHVVGHVHHGVDAVDGVLGKAAVGREAIGAVAFGAEAVVEARGVHALAAALATAAAGMDLDGDAVADFKLVHRGPELDDRAHVFMARRKAFVERRAAVDDGGQAMLDDLDVGRTHGDGVDAHQHFGATGLGHRLFDQAELLGPAQHPGLHGLGNFERICPRCHVRTPHAETIRAV
jgi:hypothetical protein